MFFSVVVLLLFLYAGLNIAVYFWKEEGGLAQLVLGICVALCLLMWLPALVSFVISFNVASQIIALAFAAGIGCWFTYLNKFAVKDFVAKLSACKWELLLLLPMLLLSIFLLCTHVLPQNQYGGLQSGQSTFGDMPMHLGFITSISAQKFFPPAYSLVGGAVPMGYPFLCDSISSTFYSLSGNLRFSYIMPMIPALFAVICGAYVFFEAWLKNKVKAFMAWFLFFIGGGFGFAYFTDMAKQDSGRFFEIFSGFYTTPMNFVEKNILWVNVIADLLIPQRATLFGWSILFPVLFLLYRAAFCGRKNYFWQIGVLGGALPLIHTHSFLALGILSACYLVFSFLDTPENENAVMALRYWFIYAAIALLIALPQLILFTFRQVEGEQFLRLHFNWVNDGDNYFWFYIKNIGLPYLLAVPAFLYAGKEMKQMYIGGLCILLLAEIIVFQPNEYDNNKLIFIWYALNCGIFSNFAVDLYGRLRDMPGIRYMAVLVLIVCNIGGVLTLIREGVSEYEVFDAEAVAAAEFIRENTEPDAIFLTTDNHNNAVASLTGRNIICGSGSYLYFHGVDYSEFRKQQRRLFLEPDMESLRANGIDYVYIGEYELSHYPHMNLEFFSENLELIYRSTNVDIYKVDASERN